MADLDKYLDLYLAEAQEHLDQLNRGLLALESGGGSDALDAAFRAAHTIKGMAAMMGHATVTDHAHHLEDRLDDLRAGRIELDPGVVDALLAGADALGAAIEAAMSGAPGGGEERRSASSPSGAEPTSADDATPPVPIPSDAEVVTRVVLAASCTMKGARAMVACRGAAKVAPVIATYPPEFDGTFDGEFWLFLGAAADAEALERAIRAAGEVDRVETRAASAFDGRASDDSRSKRRGRRTSRRGATSKEGATADGRADGRTRGVAGEASPTAEATAVAKSTDAAPADAGALAGAAPPSIADGTRYVRVDRRQLVDFADGIGDLAILTDRLDRSVRDVGDAAGPRELVEAILRRVNELRNGILALRMVPAGTIFDRLPRVVRDAARALGKDVAFQLEGRETELDREILEELVDPLVHLLRNAVDHGIEPPQDREAAGKPARGRITVRVYRERSNVRIEVADDGRGVDRARVYARGKAMHLTLGETASAMTDEDLLRLLCQPSFSTATEVSSVSGRGVGLDAVVSRIRALGGGIALQTRDGQGTTFSLRLPITLAMIQALRVRVGADAYAIPLTHVTEVVDLDQASVRRRAGEETIRIRGERIPLIRLRGVLEAPDDGVEAAAVVVELGGRRTALAVDALVGREQIVVKAFDAAVGTLRYFSGATLLSDGRPALVLDPISVI